MAYIVSLERIGEERFLTKSMYTGELFWEEDRKSAEVYHHTVEIDCLLGLPEFSEYRSHQGKVWPPALLREDLNDFCNRPKHTVFLTVRKTNGKLVSRKLMRRAYRDDFAKYEPQPRNGIELVHGWEKTPWLWQVLGYSPYRRYVQTMDYMRSAWFEYSPEEPIEMAELRVWNSQGKNSAAVDCQNVDISHEAA